MQLLPAKIVHRDGSIGTVRRYLGEARSPFNPQQREHRYEVAVMDGKGSHKPRNDEERKDGPYVYIWAGPAPAAH